MMRSRQLPFPRGALLISPWTDLSGDGANAGLKHAGSLALEQRSAGRDYLKPDMIAWIAKLARGDMPADRVPVSPMYAEGSLEGMPPIFVVYGEDEVLRGQIEAFCDTWSGKGASVQARGVAGGVHVPVMFNFCHGPSHDVLREVSAVFGAPSKEAAAGEKQGLLAAPSCC
uniref:Alpha/beta hydrolase fold-3 domain-containing protein n=1 Tax=Zooxanthella nutricula TaxID=1333877 RepID=A0A7S2NE99_9DINO